MPRNLTDRPIVPVLATLVMLGLTGCPGTTQLASPPPVHTLTSGAHCGREAEGPAVEVLADPASLERALEQNGLRLPEGSRPDLGTHWTLLIQQGRRPTLGHGVTLADPPLVPGDDGDWILRVTAHAPPPKAAVGQALTSPCLLVALPRHGLQDPLRVQDQDGREWATVRPPDAW
ncbi:MAG: protease complex subunit PrcB family protein [Ectothiorhodospira sp.]